MRHTPVLGSKWEALVGSKHALVWALNNHNKSPGKSDLVRSEVSHSDQAETSSLEWAESAKRNSIWSSALDKIIMYNIYNTYYL